MAEDYTETLSLDVSNFLGSLGAAQVALGTFAGQLAGEVLSAVSTFAGTLLDAARQVGKLAESMENLSVATGISEVHLLTLDSVMRLVGGNVEGIGMSMRILSRNMQEADQGNVDMQRKLAMLGITSRDVNTALRQAADALVKYKDDGNKVALASEVMGRGFAQLLPAIKDGSKAFDEGADRAALLGTAFDFLRDNKIKAMDDAFDRLAQSSAGLWKNMVGLAAPAIEQMAKALTELNTMITEFFSLSDADLMEAHWVRLGALMKSIASDVAGVLSGKIFSLSGIAEMNASITKIEAERDAKLAEIHKRNITSNPTAEARPTIGTPEKVETDVKALEAQHKLDLELLEDHKKVALADVQFEKEQIKEKVALREVTAMKMLEMEATAAAKDIQIKLETNNQKMRLDEAYFKARLALVTNPQERAALQAQADAALSKSNTEAALLDRQQSREGLQNVLKQNKEIEDAKKRTGESIVQNEASVYTIQRDLDKKTLEDNVHLQEALVAVYEADFRSYQEISDAKEELLVRQGLLAVHEAETAGRETLSITSKYEALIAQEHRKGTGSFVDGWKDGLSKYVSDTGSMFGLAVDMARQTAQTMTSAFQTFFFDLFSGKIQTLKDVLRGFLDFVKQIVSQVLAQLATAAALKAIAGAFGGVGASPGAAGSVDSASAGVTAYEGGLIKRFSLGGPVLSNGDSVPAMLTPGEFVVSRQGVDALNRINQGQGMGGGEGNVTVNIVGSQEKDKPQVNVRREMEGLVLDIIFRNYSANGDMRKLLQGA